jgi:hypothetical protein
MFLEFQKIFLKHISLKSGVNHFSCCASVNNNNVNNNNDYYLALLGTWILEGREPNQ